MAWVDFTSGVQNGFKLKRINLNLNEVGAREPLLGRPSAWPARGWLLQGLRSEAVRVDVSHRIRCRSTALRRRLRVHSGGCELTLATVG